MSLLISKRRRSVVWERRLCLKVSFASYYCLLVSDINKTKSLSESIVLFLLLETNIFSSCFQVICILIACSRNLRSINMNNNPIYHFYLYYSTKDHTFLILFAFPRVLHSPIPVLLTWTYKSPHSFHLLVCDSFLFVIIFRLLFTSVLTSFHT